MRAVLVLLVLWAAVAAWLLGTAWYAVERYEPRSTPPETALILKRTGYAERASTHARPFVFELAGAGGGRVVVFGAEHTKDPGDPQLELVRERWRALAPTVALVEGDLGMLFPAFMDAVRTFGETGLVHALARADGVPTYSWEPAVEVVLRHALDQGFTREEVALRWILNPYFSNLRHGRPASPEGYVRDTLRERSGAPGLVGELASIDAVDAAWARAFPDGPDWREVSDEYGLPGFLDAIDMNEPRDERLVACVAELVSAGERVFVICGSSHAVKVEPALAALLR